MYSNKKCKGMCKNDIFYSKSNFIIDISEMKNVNKRLHLTVHNISEIEEVI